MMMLNGWVMFSNGDRHNIQSDDGENYVIIASYEDAVRHFRQRAFCNPVRA